MVSKLVMKKVVSVVIAYTFFFKEPSSLTSKSMISPFKGPQTFLKTYTGRFSSRVYMTSLNPLTKKSLKVKKFVFKVCT